MLDHRHETFLELCKVLSYTKAAQVLHLTQPAVSQQIKALEAYYGHSLFEYKNKKLSLTDQGQQLHKFTSAISTDIKFMTQLLHRKDVESSSLNFGTTLSIGEFVMPPILEKLIYTKPNTQINMIVENTQHLLQKLEEGIIQFAFIEGIFNKTGYHTKLFSLEKFTAVCSPGSMLANKTVGFDDILSNRLILREKGSGTREILELQLQKQNLAIDSFSAITEIGSIALIKRLVENGYGISFMYEVAANKEIAEGKLCRVNVTGIKDLREFNFVFIKDSYHTDEFLYWFELLKEFWEAEEK